MPRNTKKILGYQDLKKISAGENGEKLVVLDVVCPSLVCRYWKKDMFPYVGSNILVRQKLAEKLGRANQQLVKLKPGARLKVVYGYRHPLIQEKYFKKIIKDLSAKHRNLDPDDLRALAHNFVAAPDVAGHTVGGAVDITIEYRGRDLDMGTSIADFSQPDKIKTFSKQINKKQAANRRLLHDLLIKQGLAPFYGEWWHFSYGDKEWACFYNKKKSLYAEIEYTAGS